MWLNEILVKFNDGDVFKARGDSDDDGEEVRKKTGLGFVKGEVKREAIIDVIVPRERRREEA